MEQETQPTSDPSTPSGAPTNEPTPSTSPTPPTTPTPPPGESSQSAGTPPGTTGGAEEAKGMAIVGYVVPLLFFLPLLNDSTKHNAFARFHANQQLNVLIMVVAGNILAGPLFFLAWLILPIVWIAYVVFLVMGLINVSNGEMKPLPVIGKFALLK